MPRSYWRIILATVGWLILANGQQASNEQQAKHGQPAQHQQATEQGSAARPVGQLESPAPKQQAPCQNPKGDSEIGACASVAQAAAANAANEISRRMLRWNIAGIIVVVLTLIATAVASWAATSAVRHTRRIGEAQVRCYLSIKSVFATVNSFGIADVAVILNNAGQSPARKFFWTSEMTYMTGMGEVHWESVERPIYEGDQPRDIPIGESGGFGRTHLGRILSDEEGAALRESHAIMFTAEITIRWEDVFGQEFSETHKFQGGSEKPYVGVPVALQPTFPFKIVVAAT